MALTKVTRAISRPSSGASGPSPQLREDYSNPQLLTYDICRNFLLQRNIQVNFVWSLEKMKELVCKEMEDESFSFKDERLGGGEYTGTTNRKIKTAPGGKIHVLPFEKLGAPSRGSSNWFSVNDKPNWFKANFPDIELTTLDKYFRRSYFTKARRTKLKALEDGKKPSHQSAIVSTRIRDKKKQTRLQTFFCSGSNKRSDEEK